MNSLRTAIIVSPYFPPSTLAGVHRARHLARHLPASGWRPIIVCVDERFHEQKLDPELARLVPPDTDIVKVSSLSAKFARPLGIGDVGLRGWAQMRKGVLQLVASHSNAVVLITGGPFYPMLLAPELRKIGVPVVLDFQDPWVSAWGASQPALSKTGLSHRLAKMLEPRALRGARFVTSVSDTQNSDMAKRYRWLDPTRMAALPIGGDPDDFDRLRSGEACLPDGIPEVNCVNLSFVGTFMPRSGPLVQLVLKALAMLRQQEPGVGGQIRLNFVGTSNQPDDISTFRVLPLAREAGVEDAVREIPQRLPYMTALAVLARSEGVLLIGSDEAHYTASKIYPALMCGRPFLSLFHAGSSSHEILSAAGGGIAHVYPTDRAGDAGTIEGIAASLRRMVTDRASLGRVEPAVYAPYEARAIAAKFAAIFAHVRHMADERQWKDCDR